MSLSIPSSASSAEQIKGAAKRPRKYWKRYSSRTLYLFIAPWVLGFLGLTIMPLGYALLMSFTNFDGISPHWHWIGLTNYVDLFHDGEVWYSLSRTLLYTCIGVPLGLAGGLALALLLNQRLQGVGLFRTIFYLPSIVPIVASAIMWKLILDRDAGALNAILEHLGGQTVTWLVDPVAFYALIVLILWGLGGGMVIFLAGLQGIPTELVEAARVDGANGWQRLRAVTVPLLSPVIFFQMVMGVIGSLQTFIQPLLLTPNNGTGSIASVPRSNELFMVNAYQQFFYFQRYGYGSAMLWLLFLVILVFTLLIFRSSNFWVYYEVDRDEQ
jgi:multiple sugar transport system permease protein